MAAEVAKVAVECLLMADDWLRVSEHDLLSRWVLGKDECLRWVALTSPDCAEELRVVGFLLGTGEVKASLAAFFDAEVLARSIVMSVVSDVAVRSRMR